MYLRGDLLLHQKGREAAPPSPGWTLLSQLPVVFGSATLPRLAALLDHIYSLPSPPDVTTELMVSRDGPQSVGIHLPIWVLRDRK